MQQVNIEEEREKAVHQYVTALDRGDMNGIGAVLKAALTDIQIGTNH